MNWSGPKPKKPLKPVKPRTYSLAKDLATIDPYVTRANTTAKGKSRIVDGMPAFRPQFNPVNVQTPEPQGLAEKLRDITPFVSNFANAFRRAPEPAFPRMQRPVTFAKVNFDADRADIDRTVAGMNRGTEALGENQAAAVRTANMIQGIRGKNQLAQQEQNTNAQIANSAAAMNAQLEGQNVAYENQYRDAQVNQDMVNMSMRSANMANAADKYTAIQNERERAKLEGTKYKILSEIYKDSGVLDRLTDDFKVNPRTGLPERKYGGTMKYSAGRMQKVFAAGGMLEDPKPKPRTAYTTNSYIGSNIYSRTEEADRAGDAMVISPRTKQFIETQLNMAPRPAQTAEALRSGDYFAPPAPRHQYVTLKTVQRAPELMNMMNTVVKKFGSGGKLRKVY